MLAAIVTTGVSLALATGGAEARLLKRAAQSLGLAEGDLSRANRARLRRSANDDVARALELRRTGRAYWYLGVCALASTAIVFLVPWYAQTDRVAASSWEPTFWIVLWALYVVLALALWVAFARVSVRRSRVAAGEAAKPAE